MTNPGPVKDPCTVCSKGRRKNQKAIQCDSCDGWFHAKCINMKSTEYSQLCNDSMAWECMSCLFPSMEIPIRSTSKSPGFDEKEKSGTNIRTEMNPGLNKRGMKFAHVNVVTYRVILPT